MYRPRPDRHLVEADYQRPDRIRSVDQAANQGMGDVGRKHPAPDTEVTLCLVTGSDRVESGSSLCLCVFA